MGHQTPTRVFHIDIDSFFISVEELYDPNLREMPAATYHSGGPITSANYLAKALGIDSATRIKDALKIYPELVLVKEHPERYAKVTHNFFSNLVKHYGEKRVEYYSDDEAFIDYSGLDLVETLTDAIQTLQDLREKLHLRISGCLAPNKWLAKMGTNRAKPNGFLYLGNTKLVKIFYNDEVEEFHGINKKIGNRLRKANIQRIGDIAATPLANLYACVGVAKGSMLYYLSRGIDGSPVIPLDEEIPNKSFSNTVEVAYDSNKFLYPRPEDIKRAYRYLAWKVAKRMQKERYDGRTVTASLRYEKDEQLITTRKSKSLPKPQYFDKDEAIFSIIEKWLFPQFLIPESKKIRVGVKVTNVVKGRSQLRLL